MCAYKYEVVKSETNSETTDKIKDGENLIKKVEGWNIYSHQYCQNEAERSWKP